MVTTGAILVLFGWGCAASSAGQTVRLPTRTVSVGSGIDQRLTELRAKQAHPIPIVVVVPQALTPVDRSDLATLGVRLQQSLGGNAHLALLDPTAKLEALRERVVWVAPIDPVDRVDPQLWRGEAPKWALQDRDRVKVLVRFYEFVGAEEARGILQRFATNLRAHEPSGAWAAEIPIRQVRDLAASLGVKWIEPGPDPMMPLVPK